MLVVPLLWAELDLDVYIIRFVGAGIWVAVGVTLSMGARRRRVDRGAVLRGLVVVGLLIEWQLDDRAWTPWRWTQPLGLLWLTVAIVAARGERRSTVVATLLLFSATVVERVTSATVWFGTNCDCACRARSSAKGFAELSPEIARCAVLVVVFSLWAVVSARRERKLGEVASYGLSAAVAGVAVASYGLLGAASASASGPFPDLAALESFTRIGGWLHELALPLLGFLGTLALGGLTFGPRRSRGARRTFARVVPILFVGVVAGAFGQWRSPWDRLELGDVTPPVRENRQAWFPPGIRKSQHLLVDAAGDLELHPVPPPDPYQRRWSTDPGIMVVADASTPMARVRVAIHAAAALEPPGGVALLLRVPADCCSRIAVPARIRSPGWSILDLLGPRLGALPVQLISDPPTEVETACLLSDEGTLAEALGRAPDCGTVYVETSPSKPVVPALAIEPLPFRRVDHRPSVIRVLWGVAVGVLVLMLLVVRELRALRGCVRLVHRGLAGSVRPVWLSGSEITHGWAPSAHWGYRASPHATTRGPASTRDGMSALGRRSADTLRFLCRWLLFTTVMLGLGFCAFQAACLLTYL